MAKVKKTKSGKWRVRIYNYTDENGKRIYECITRDTKVECEYAAAEFMRSGRGVKPEPRRLTVGDAVDQYIDLCRTLSPSTVAEYRKMRRNGFQDLMDMPVDELDDIIVQQAVNKECLRMSYAGRPVAPKTVKNEWGLISSALRKICKRSYDVSLPRVARNIDAYPDPEDVVQAFMGSSIELPCLLALWLSFSMSEIRGIRYSSIRDGCIYIDQVVIDVDNVPINKKIAKVDTRNRRLQIPDMIMDLIAQDEGYRQYLQDGIDDYLVPLTSNQLSKRFGRLMEKHNIRLTFHGLRHLNASVMLQQNIPEKYAMERGGWKTPHVMKSVYQHTFSSARKAVDAQVDTYFENLISGKP